MSSEIVISSSSSIELFKEKSLTGSLIIVPELQELLEVGKVSDSQQKGS